MKSLMQFTCTAIYRENLVLVHCKSDIPELKEFFLHCSFSNDFILNSNAQQCTKCLLMLKRSYIGTNNADYQQIYLVTSSNSQYSALYSSNRNSARKQTF